MENQHNPWQSEASQGSPYRSDSPPQHTQHNQQNQWQQSQPQPQSQSQSQSYGWSNPNALDNQSHQSNPWGGQESQGAPPTTNQYQPPPQPPPQQQQQQYQTPPNPPPRRTDSETAALLASQPDRGEQLEHLQNYEASKRLTDDDRNQADLQKQFPGIDSSLIAAIYSDHKDQRGGQVDLSSIRETLQELQS